MKTTLLDQIRERRLELRLKIQDMPLLSGLTRQQYGKIEAGGNPRLNTLDQIAEALGASLVLVPKEMVEIVERILAAQRLADQGERVEEILAGLSVGKDPSGQVATSQPDLFPGEEDNPWGTL